MSRSARIAAVTLGLAAAGAVFGAVAAAIVLLVALFLTYGVRVGQLHHAPWLVVTLFGAALGAGAAPAAGWLLLRRVPLGLAVAGSVAGAVAGGVAGWVVRPAAPVPGALLGFAAAVVLLRLRASRPRERMTRG